MNTDVMCVFRYEKFTFKNVQNVLQKIFLFVQLPYHFLLLVLQSYFEALSF